MDLGNPKNTIEVIQKYNFAFQKKFGQNFLIDTHVLDKIISAAGMTKEDTVLEVGPGIGTMTQRLSQAAGQVIAVEIDCFQGWTALFDGAFQALRHDDGRRNHQNAVHSDTDHHPRYPTR